MPYTNVVLYDSRTWVAGQARTAGDQVRGVDAVPEVEYVAGLVKFAGLYWGEMVRHRRFMADKDNDGVR